MENLTSQFCRDQFKARGLSYTDINAYNFNQLTHILSEELAKYAQIRNGQSEFVNMRLSKIGKRDINITKKDGFISAFLMVDGAYFEQREAISFNGDGFIGFGGWASTANCQPFCKAFMRWIELISNKEQADV